MSLQPLHRAAIAEGGSGFVHSTVYLEEFKATEITIMVITTTAVQNPRTCVQLPIDTRELNGRKSL